MLSVNTNISSLNAQRSLLSNSQRAAVSMERLTSGTRINSAKDDAAGMGVATRFNSQISGMRQAIRNASDAVSMLQVAEGGLGSMVSNLQRIRELAVQAASDTVTDYDRAHINKEVSQLVTEINRIADTTRYNDKTLLDGTFASSGLTVQVGANNTADDRMDVTIADFNTNALALHNKQGPGIVASTAVTGFASGLTASVNGGASISITAVDTTNIFDGSASYAQAVAAELNALENISAAVGATSVNLGTMTLSGLADPDDYALLVINGVTVPFYPDDLQDLTSTKAKTVIDSYISTNNPPALTNINVNAAGGDGGNELVITDTTGKQLQVSWTLTDLDQWTGWHNSEMVGGGFEREGSDGTYGTPFNAGSWTPLSYVNGGPGWQDYLSFAATFTSGNGSWHQTRAFMDSGDIEDALADDGFVTVDEVVDFMRSGGMGIQYDASSGDVIVSNADSQQRLSFGYSLRDGGEFLGPKPGNTFTGTATSNQTLTDLGTISVSTAAYSTIEFTNALGSGLVNSEPNYILSVSSVQEAGTAIDAVDNALNAINVGRAEIGASQSRFESVIANLERGVDSATAGRSRVLDADFAIESAELAKHQILQQASISVLAQANSRPEMVLALLRDF